MKIYAGNLSYSTSSEDLWKTFEEYGNVESADVIMDRNTNRSKGFGFVEMTNEAEAKAAISSLNGKEMDGRALNISEARPRNTESRGSYRY
ncbi:MAG: RNA-binding protein [Actinomycetota bacterium]|nr:RNA-binding protein [Actinomycetota bacterium]MDD5667240.1 RNA-binding protein [Actinomycetota bacterium]